MRIGFAIFLTLHGLAHLVGVLGPWGLLPAPAPGAPPAPPMNVLFGGRVALGEMVARAFSFTWLAVALAFVIVAGGWWRHTPWSRNALIAVALASLLLSIAWWPLAKVGVFINAGILLTVLGSGYVAYRQDLRDARSRVSTGSQVLATSAGNIEFASLGAGDPVLVVHGTGGGWDQGLLAATRIVPQGYRLLAPSRFGYLRTPMPADPTPAAEADAYVALLDALKIERAAVMSFSAGAAPALQMALRHPDRVSALVLVVPAAGGVLPPLTKGPPPFVLNVVMRFDLPMWLAIRYSTATMSNLMAVPRSLLDSLAPGDKAEYEKVVRTLLPITARRRGLLNDARNQSGGESVYTLERITAPTLLVSAEDDLYRTLAVARVLRARIHGARLIAFKTGGHLLLGRGDELRPQVGAFLRDSRQALARPEPSAAPARILVGAP